MATNRAGTTDGTAAVSMETPNSYLLSKRMSAVSGDDNMMTWGFMQCLENPYDADKSPQGIINMGVSENKVMHKEMTDWFNARGQQWDSSMMVYNDYLGLFTLREALAEFLTEQGHAPAPLDPNKVIILNGGDTCIEALGFCLAEPNDAILCPTPYYGAIKANFGMRADVNIFPLHLSSQIEAGETSPFQLTVEKLERAMQEAKDKNVNIRGLIVVNPHNPLGDMLSREQLMDILMFCKRHAIHVIMDEVYMLTVFGKEAEHYSILRLKASEIPDPQRTHFIYSFSKDFCLSALRVACIYTWNDDLVKTCSYMACFQQSAPYIQLLLAKLLRDKDFIQKTYIPSLQQRLYESHECVIEALRELDIPHLNRSAGLYVWTDLRKYLSSNTYEAEEVLLKRLLRNGVYITPSVAFYGKEPGWFRIIYSSSVANAKTGMDRIAKVCREIEKEGTVGPEPCTSANRSNVEKAEGSPIAASTSNGSSLEGLLSQLSTQIQGSDWLEQNTADQWKSSNPETYKAFMSEKEKQ